MKKLILLIFLVFSLLLNSILYSQNFWQQTNGPYGGTATCLACKNNADLFCGTYNGGGIYKSTNDGTNWNKVYGDTQGSQTWGLTFDSSGSIYASNHGIIKSSDNGFSWTLISTLPAVYSISANSNGRILAGLGTGFIYRSTDGGANFTQVFASNANNVWKIIEKNKGTIYAILSATIVKSTNDGISWQQINSGGISGGTDASIDSTESLIVCTSNGLYRTSNEGLQWQQICNIPSLVSFAMDLNNYYYVGNSYGQIFESTNLGVSWIQVYSSVISNYNPAVLNIICKPGGKIFAGFYYLGVVRSTDAGTNWERINNGISNQITSKLYNVLGRIFAGSFNDGLFMTSNMGNSWSQLGLANKYITALGSIGINNIFAYTTIQQGGLFRTTDGGLTWLPSNIGLPVGYSVYDIKSIDSTVYVATNNGIYKSVDYGIDWITSGLNGYSINILLLNSINIMIAANNSLLFRSTDYGSNWQRIDSSGNILNCMGISSNNDYLYLCRINGGLYRSTNNGNNWLLINNNSYFYNLVCNSSGYVFGSSSSGVYRSTDLGLNWQQLNSGLFNTNAGSLTTDQSDFLYVSTWGSGVFRSIGTTVSISSPVSFISQRFSLSQNYPNPFNPTTNIKFDLPKSGFVRLTIYDALGREVVTIVNSEMKAGSYKADWDASSYSSGIYFYKLNVQPSDRSERSDGYIATKKMVLIK